VKRLLSFLRPRRKRAENTADLDTPAMGFGPVASAGVAEAFARPAVDEPAMAPSHEEGPYPGSALPGTDGAAPTEEFTIKGDQKSMIYHTGESPSYGATRADVWFRSEADAQRAGFTAWRAKIDANGPAR
jgi:hypothetical protein